MHINVCHVDLNDLLDRRKNEDELTYLSRSARNVLCVPTTSASSVRNFSVARLVMQER
jgi:hypothetical protein